MAPLGTTLPPPPGLQTLSILSWQSLQVEKPGRRVPQYYPCAPWREKTAEQLTVKQLCRL